MFLLLAREFSGVWDPRFDDPDRFHRTRDVVTGPEILLQ